MGQNQPSGHTVGVDTSQPADHSHGAVKGPQGLTRGEHRLVCPQAWAWEGPGSCVSLAPADPSPASQGTHGCPTPAGVLPLSRDLQGWVPVPPRWLLTHAKLATLRRSRAQRWARGT